MRHLRREPPITINERIFKMTTCKDHTESPDGYIQWHEWAKEKGKTHNQKKCGECGLYKIWVLKKQRVT